MTRILMLIFALFLTTDLIAQNCKFEKNEVDKFTHKKVIITEPYMIWRDSWSGSNMTVQGYKSDSLKWIRFRYSSTSIFSIHQKSKLILLFEDGSTVDLFNIESIVADPIHAGSMTRWVAFVSYGFTDDIEKKILSKKITSIRLYTADGYIDKEVKGKDSNSFKDAINCIQN
ncbi:hypothetical protein [Adhaeribacter soli]|uniref:Uncharacterized protein n=1 Tax=Adhaeribacter soli TaxID=2607655 RepID=A0A5N1J0P1_9BACT|nr:hypothetical protein [Adhaeribacter soli]KAA9340111.1 hypothetical protein F0P94_07115 [Adhaeribacter soli]